MRSVRISLKMARYLADALEAHLFPDQLAVAAVEELRAALKPKKSVQASRKRRETKGLTKKEETAAIREAVMKRAGGQCENCLAHEGPAAPLELDHMFGRVRVKQSERNCWALCRPCHRGKTNNAPTAWFWLRVFAAHAFSHGYAAEARMADARFEALSLSRGREAAP